MSTSSSFLSNGKFALQFLEMAAEVIPQPAKGSIRAMVGALVVLIDHQETLKKNKEDCRALIERTCAITCAIVKTSATVTGSHTVASDATSTLLDNIAEFKRTIALITHNVQQLQRPGHFNRAEHVKEVIQASNRELDEAAQLFSIRLDISLHDRLEELNMLTISIAFDLIECSSLINLLPHVPFAGWDVDKCCLKDTRVEILKQIVSWAEDTSPDIPRIFWFTGPAGSGKTTIVHSIAQKLQDAGMLGGTFFFKRDIAEQSDPAKVITTLAHDIASHSLSFKIAIAKILKEDSSIPTSPSAQLQKLLVKPLLTQGSTKQMCLLLDALDECGTEETRKPLLKALAMALPELQNIKLFVTSRSLGPQADIDQVFEKQLRSITAHLKLDAMENHRDILLYTQIRLQEIATAKDLDPTWPGHHMTQKLAQSTDGLFLWAYIACNFIANSYRPDESLMDFISEEPADGDEKLGIMYATALKHIKAQSLGKAFIHDCCRVLGAIVTVRDPLPADALAELLEENLSIVLGIIKRLDCLLVTQSTGVPFVRVIHGSLARWLISPSNTSLWKVSSIYMHRLLGVRSLSIMNHDLHMDILGLSSGHFYELHHPIWVDIPGQEWMIHSHITLKLQYACQFGITHLLELEPNQEMQNLDIGRPLSNVITLKPLEWIEVLAYLQKLTWAVEVLERLLKWLQVVSGPIAVIRNYVYDMKRFIQSFGHGIQESPLQIYLSALLFTPRETMLYKCYHQHINKLPVKLLQGYKLKWGRILNTITGHEESVEAVAFSPNCALIASGSYDMTVRIWDVRTGSSVGQPFQGHTWCVRSVAFSPDGTLIASGSSDKTVCIWDVRTGAMICQPLQGHTDQVASVAFSPDGALIASGSHDKTVRIWVARIGTPVGQPLKGHSSLVTSVAFSHDGTLIASGSYDKTVRIWDAKYGIEVGQPFQGHTWCVTSVAFSPDGSLLASGSYDKTVCIWDTRTGRIVGQPLQGHTSFITSVAFSPDGNLIASGSSSAGTATASESSDKAVCIWDVKTGTEIGPPLRHHAGGVRSLAFSSDGSFIASGSDDKTVCIWEAESGNIVSQSQGCIDAIRCVAFSPDGALIASGSDDKTVHIWDTKTGMAVGQPLQGHTHWVTAVAFSPDGMMIASGSEDKTVCIWEVGTGILVSQMLGRHTYQIASVVFSPDSTLIASGAHDGIIYIWNARTGTAVDQPLQLQHKASVIAVAFSPDGTLIASGLDDRTVCIWNVGTSTAHGKPLQGHVLPVTSVAFSPNGTLIVSGSHDGTVCIWDVETCTAVGQPLQRHTSFITSVAFSPDGSYIISGSGDATVHIWDTKTATTSDTSSQNIYEDRYAKPVVHPPYNIYSLLLAVKRPSGNIWLSRYSPDTYASPFLWIPHSFCGTPYFHFQAHDNTICFVFTSYSSKLTIIQVKV